jgi:uncharacterized membrane protein YphA (DoxX/SURF4 family)
MARTADGLVKRSAAGAWLALGARLAIGAIFVLAGATKLSALGTFTATLLAYDILPVSLLRPVALILPWAEVVVGLYLLAGLFARAAAWGAIGLLAVFMLAIGQAVIRGLSLEDCGCFGSITAAVPALQYVLGGSSLGPADLWRDAVYVALALFVALGPQAPFSADALLARRQAGRRSVESRRRARGPDRRRRARGPATE